MRCKMLVLSYPDFRRMANENNKKIYYYQMDNIIELLFISEGIFVKSFVDLTEIENKEVFFGQQMFVNAVRLLFRVPNPPDTNIGLIGDTPKIIENVSPIESIEQEKDLQKEAVKEHIPGV